MPLFISLEAPLQAFPGMEEKQPERPVVNTEDKRRRFQEIDNPDNSQEQSRLNRSLDIGEFGANNSDNQSLQVSPRNQEQISSLDEASQDTQNNRVFLNELKKEFGDEIGQWAFDKGELETSPLNDSRRTWVIGIAREKAKQAFFKEQLENAGGEQGLFEILLEMLKKGDGLVGSDFFDFSDGSEPSRTINPFNAKAFLGLLAKAEDGSISLPSGYDGRDLAGGVLFSLATICEDINEQVAMLKVVLEQVQEKEKREAISSEESYKISEQLKLLERYLESLTKLNKSSLDAGQLFKDEQNLSAESKTEHFFKIVTLLNHSLSLHEQSLQAVQKGDIQRALCLFNQSIARCEETHELARENRPHIIQGYEEAFTLSTEALTALQSKALLKAQCVRTQTVTRLRATIEAAEKNRPHIIQGYEEAFTLSTEALTLLGQGDSQKSLYLSDKAIAGMHATIEAAEKNRPQVIQNHQETFRLYSEAITAFDRGARDIATTLWGQANAGLYVTLEARGKNRPQIIKGYEEIFELYNKTFTAFQHGARNIANYLNSQALTRFKTVQEATEKNRPQIIKGYKETFELYKKAFTAFENGDRDIATTSNTQATVRLKATIEAAEKNRPQIIKGYEEAFELYTKTLTALANRDPDIATTSNNQATVRLRATIEAAEKNRPQIIKGYEEAFELYTKTLTALANRDRKEITDLHNLAITRFTTTIAAEQQD